jgi:xanthine dehydrogenase accessory factor
MFEECAMENEFDLFERITEAKKRGQSVALATVISTYKSAPRKAGAKMLVYSDGTTAGTIGGGVLEAAVIKEALKAIAKGQPARVEYSMEPENPKSLRMCCGGEIELFIDVIHSQAPLIIFGGGHVGEKVARLAGMIGLPYVVVDDRKEYANRKRFPAASRLFQGNYDDAFKNIPIDGDSYIVVCTRGHAYDLLCLKEALKSEAAYIGVIASKKKAAQFRAQLEKEGVRVSDNRVFSPIGLDLGDSSPGQIALSIIAEIVKLQSGGSAAHKRLQN